MRTLSPLVALVAAGPALALSCLPPDPATTFRRAEAAEERYVVVRGALALPGGALSPDGHSGAGDATAAGRIDGRALGADGRFTAPFDAPVAVTATCIGPWCGAVGPVQDAVMFLERTAEGYALRVGPCGGETFEATPEVLDTIAACRTGGPCRAAWEG